MTSHWDLDCPNPQCACRGPAAVDDRLDRAAVAARFGIQPDSVTREVNRGDLPKPDGYVGRSPWWWSSTLDNWQRPGRTGRPRKRTMNSAPTKGG